MQLLARSSVLLTTAALTRRCAPLVTPRAALSMSADIESYTKTMWKDVFAAGQTKDAEKIGAAFDKYYKEDCVIIRPSGNPLSLEGWKGMLGSEDVVVSADEVTSVDDVKMLAGGAVAVVVFTTRSTFTYMGTPNDDVAKFSATLEKIDGAWKVAHVHRGTGQAPE